MDLIYMNGAREDVGVMKDCAFDLAFGADENDFECRIASENHCCEKKFFLYIEGTEYGGMIDDLKVDTSAGEITYIGRTWHGILNSKILEPDAGEAYLIVSGEANAALATLIQRLGLSELFRASDKDSGITVKSYKMNRYIAGYDGIRKMLKASGAKLNIKFNEGMVELSAVPFIDYSKDEQFDTDQIDFVVREKGSPVNHVVCLGKGELTERVVRHVYADTSGNITDSQVYTGLSEVTRVYENTSVESEEELIQGGIDIIKESWNANEVSIDFDADDTVYDIGDIVGAKERITGIEVSAEVTKKIVTIKNNFISITYKVGE